MIEQRYFREPHFLNIKIDLMINAYLQIKPTNGSDQEIEINMRLLHFNQK